MKPDIIIRDLNFKPVNYTTTFQTKLTHHVKRRTI